MKVFGLQGPLYRNARAASRIEANERSEKAKSRDAALRRWHEARRNGLTAANAAKAVSVPVSTLYAWDKARRRGGLKALEPRSTAPRKRRAKTWKTETLTALENLRNDYPMWGKRRTTSAARRGTEESASSSSSSDAMATTSQRAPSAACSPIWSPEAPFSRCPSCAKARQEPRGASVRTPPACQRNSKSPGPDSSSRSIP